MVLGLSRVKSGPAALEMLHRAPPFEGPPASEPDPCQLISARLLQDELLDATVTRWYISMLNRESGASVETFLLTSAGICSGGRMNRTR